MRKQTLIKLLFTLVIIWNEIHIYAQNTVYQTLYNDGTFTKSISTGLPVGVIDGQQGTTQTGAATYTIPIKVTPGINGMEPKLAITYNSQSGNGLLGVGWNLSGLSAITLDNKNIYYNGKVSPMNIAPVSPDYDASFALDGMHLIAVNGIYGAPGTTYSTELENYSVIKSEGTGNITCACPSYFTVRTKDGLSMEYGNIDRLDAFIRSNGNEYPIMWRLNRTTDINGNYIDYKYSITSDGESKIDEINYTGNSTTSVAPFAKVKFIYSVRSDQNNSYVIGSNSTNATTLKSKWLLDKIVITTDGGQSVKTYQFNYASDGLYSVLQEVKEIGSDNTELNSTIFRYGNPKELDPTSSNITTLTSNNVSTTNSDNFTGDFDGDGFTDILTAYYPSSTNKNYTSFKVFRKIPGTNNFQDLYTYTIPSTMNYSGTTYNVLRKINVADYNGDGKTDILFDNYITNITTAQNSPIPLIVGGTAKISFSILYNTSSSTSINFSNTDYNNNTFTPYAFINYYTNVSPAQIVKNPIISGDFDGDGYTDLISTYKKANTNSLGIGEGKTFITRPNAGEFYSPIQLYSNGSTSDVADYFTNNNVIAVADFDGDGKQEILLDNGMIFYLRKNANSQWEFGTISTYITSGYKVFTGDFNGDGKTDILTRVPDGQGNIWEVDYSTGYTFDRKSISLVSGIFGGTPDYNNMNVIIADFNGDGKSDILQQIYFSTSSVMHMYYSNGIDFKYKYSTFTNNDKYTPDITGDFDGDGAVDILNKSRNTHAINGKPYLIVSFGNQQKERFLMKVIDGYNRKTEFTYLSLTSGLPFYDNGNGPTAYLLSIYSLKLPLYAVSAINVPDGIGGFYNITYKYKDIVLGRYGKGFLGFSKITETNQLNNISTETNFETSINTTTNTLTSLFPVSINQYQGSTSISSKNITRTFSFLGNKRYKAEITSIINQDNIKGTYETTTNTFDANGNITKSILNKSGVETITTDYQNIDNNYYTVPFQFKDIVVTTVRGSKTYVNKTNYSYDNKGRIFNKIENYQSTTKPKNIAYTYDSYGNIATTTYSGNTSAGGTINYTKSEYYLDGKGRYLNMIINPNVTNLIAFGSFDNRWGKPGYSGNYNGMISAQYAYDPFGRLIKTSPISPSYTIPYTIDTKYDWSTQYGSIYKVTTSATGVQVFQPETKYYDAFDRLVRQEKTENGKQKFTTNYYDAKGDIIKVETNDANGGIITTNNSYDNYHRLINSTNVTTSVTTTNTYSALYSAGVTTSTTITGQPSKITKTDGTGKITEVTETGGTTSVKNIYTYHANGNILKVSQGANDLVTYDYDENANQIQLKDVDAGITNYEYDAFGNITKQTDANGNEMNMKYNTYNQLYNKTIKDNNYPTLLNNVNYYYNAPSINGENKISKIEYTNNIDVGESIVDEFAYDIVDRLKQQDRTFEGKKFSTIYDYDDYRLIAVTQPKSTTTGIPLKVNYTTTSDGFVTKVNTNAGISTDVFTAINTDYNANDQITKYNYPNGMKNEILYDFLGLPDYIKSTKTSGNTVLHSLSYNWNTQNGNLNSKNDYWSGKGESYQYDEFNRLKIITPNGSTSTLDIGFDGNGNILKKYDAGIKYEYKTDKIHAVEKIKAGMGYTNPVKPDDRTDISTVTQDIKTNPSNATSTYNAFNQPSLISEGTNELKYIYDYNGQRIKSIYKESGTLKTTRYYFGNYEFETNGGAITTDASTTRQLYYINAPDGLASMFVRENSTDKYYYIHKDHLGSIETVTDATANVVSKQNFDAWGRQRDPISWSYTISALPPPAWLYRGYTGHEMLSKFSLINMNGRLYDPIVGRMLSPDNIIHDIYNTQHYNRYSYVWNNPLKFTDPLGEDGNDNGFDIPVWNPIPTYGSNGVSSGLSYQFNLYPYQSVYSATITSNLQFGGYYTNTWSMYVSYNTLLNIYNVLVSSNIQIADQSQYAPTFPDGFYNFTPPSLNASPPTINLQYLWDNSGDGGFLSKVWNMHVLGWNTMDVDSRETFEMLATVGTLGNPLGTELSPGSVGLSTVSEGSSSALVKYWPENNGALGEWSTVMAQEGQIMDRYGSIYGQFTSPLGTPFAMRALSPMTNIDDYFMMEVMKSFPMQTSTIAPAFGQIGLGTQYFMPIQINYLIDLGYLRIIK